MKPKIYVTRMLPPPGVELLERVCDVEVNPDEAPPGRDLLIGKARDADGILCLLTDRIDADLGSVSKF